MRVSGLTAGGDWTFGRGKANYKAKSQAVRQSVVTRLREFQNDYFADIGRGIDWITIMGQRGNQDRIKREIERRVLSTEGVRTIDKLEITQIRSDRSATIELRYTDFFDETYLVQDTLP